MLARRDWIVCESGGRPRARVEEPAVAAARRRASRVDHAPEERDEPAHFIFRGSNDAKKGVLSTHRHLNRLNFSSLVRD